MAIVIPGTAVNYPNPLLAIGLKPACVPVGQNPVNGPQCIPVEIDWGSMGGNDKIVGFNIGNSGGTRAFQDLCALHVDNSQCGADVEFIFTDTQITYTIPAYSAYVLIPIFTKSLQFYCVSKIDGQVVETSDITRFLIFNFVPPPVTVPTGQEQDSTSVGGIDSTGPATTQVVPAGTNGSLNVVYVNFSTPGATGIVNAGLQTWQLIDGSTPTPKVLASGQMAGGVGSSWNVVLMSISGVDFRFANGIQFKLAGTQLGGTYNVLLGYRQP